MPIHTSRTRTLRQLALMLSTSLLLALAACAAPSATNGQSAPDAVAQPAAPGGQDAAPDQPHPRPAGEPVKLDLSCGSDADCTVKNVGNCCGEYPACVNVDSPTDPAAVQAECERTGRMSTCGFPAITSCQCVQGECKGSNQALLP